MRILILKINRFKGTNFGTCINSACDDTDYEFFDGTPLKFEYFTYAVQTLVLDDWFATLSYPDLYHENLDTGGVINDHLFQDKRFACQVNCASKMVPD